MKKYKIIIFGASSKTGEAIVRLAQQETSHDIILVSATQKQPAPDLNYKLYNYNITDIKEIKNICYAEKPDFIINTAGLSDPDICEKNKELAYRLNTNLVESLVTVSRVLDSHLIIISTDNVFDGAKGPYAEQARPDPINYFGKTKHAAENACLAGLEKFTIIRTNWIYGPSSYERKDFFFQIYQSINNNTKIKLSTEQHCNPTYVYDIALAVLKIIEKGRTGIYNVGGTDWLSMYDIAMTYCNIFSFNHNLLMPSQRDTFNEVTARRLKNGGLITLKTETDLNMKLTPLASGLTVLRYQALTKNNFMNDVTYY